MAWKSTVCETAWQKGVLGHDSRQAPVASTAGVRAACGAMLKHWDVLLQGHAGRAVAHTCHCFVVLAVCMSCVCREGKFHVLQEEPDLTAADMLGLGFSLPAGLGSMAGYSLSRDSPFNNSEEQASEFAVGELDLLKAQLEALLPASSLDGDDEAVQDS